MICLGTWYFVPRNRKLGRAQPSPGVVKISLIFRSLFLSSFFLSLGGEAPSPSFTFFHLREIEIDRIACILELSPLIHVPSPTVHDP